MTEPTFQSLLQNFFLKRLMQQRNVSQNTISSYRDTFRLFFEFLKSKYRIDPSDISIEQMNLEYIEGFCNYLTEERSCRSSTVNNRLSAIKSSYNKFKGNLKRTPIKPLATLGSGENGKMLKRSERSEWSFNILRRKFSPCKYCLSHRNVR